MYIYLYLNTFDMCAVGRQSSSLMRILDTYIFDWCKYIYLYLVTLLPLLQGMWNTIRWVDSIACSRETPIPLTVVSIFTFILLPLKDVVMWIMLRILDTCRYCIFTFILLPLIFTFGRGLCKYLYLYLLPLYVLNIIK